MLAAFGAFLSVALVLIFIPAMPKQSAKKTTATGSGGQGLFGNLGEIFKLFKLPEVGYLLVVKLICGIPIGVLQSMFSSKVSQN